jgi:hypothetical protein
MQMKYFLKHVKIAELIFMKLLILMNIGEYKVLGVKVIFTILPFGDKIGKVIIVFTEKTIEELFSCLGEISITSPHVYYDVLY